MFFLSVCTFDICVPVFRHFEPVHFCHWKLPFGELLLVGVLGQVQTHLTDGYQLHSLRFKMDYCYCCYYHYYYYYYYY